MTSFDLNEPLPQQGHTLLLEASAGTGKTYAISYLVARYVASGLPIRSVLAVTFTRRATAELRDGIRVRLMGARAAYRAALAGDQIDQRYAEWIDHEDRGIWDQSLDNIEAALADIDSAPIYTLHQFAITMLCELGVLADHDSATQHADDTTELASQVIRDTYLSHADAGRRISWKEATNLGRLATTKTFQRVLPADHRHTPFVTDVKEEFARRKRVRRILDFDDMISRLVSALADDETGELAAQILSSRFPVVLVDEFQDTDAQQWEFIKLAFHTRSALILIGDPKQAIYRFRGGDIATYLRARSTARTARLGTNYRSDEAVVRGIEALFGYGTDFSGTTDPITLEKVKVKRTGSRLRHAGGDFAAVNVRAINPDNTYNFGASTSNIKTDVVGYVSELIGSGIQINAHGWRPVNHGDIAILVNSRKFGRQLQAELAAAGHPAVMTGSTSVFDTDEADHWLVVLEALVSQRPPDIRRAALTPMIGLTSADLASEDQTRLVQATNVLTKAARLLRSDGVAAAFNELQSMPLANEQLLAQQDHDTVFMNYRHVMQLLNSAQRDGQLSPIELLDYLRAAIEQTGSESEQEETRRLPTAEPAIQIMTIHASKGSQFPIVLLPQVTLSAPTHDPTATVFTDQGEWDLTPSDEQRRTAYEEELAESLRLLYVACTRAQSMLTLWWSPTQFWRPNRQHDQVTARSALHRLLSRGPNSTDLAEEYPLGSAHNLRVPAGVTLRIINPDTITSGDPRVAAQPASAHIQLRPFRNHIDRSWTRTSYSGLTADLHDAPGQTPPSELDDEPDIAFSAVSEVTSSPVSALADLPGGTVFGTLVHELLEAVDPSQATLPEDLAAALAEREALAAGVDAPALIAGLQQAVETDLGVLTDGRSLADLGVSHRLAELDFEMPLGTAGQNTVRDLAGLFTALPADDPLKSYGEQLATSPAADTILNGFLTGSIDAVYELPDTHRFVIFDYKTNVISTDDEHLTARHYDPQAMTRLMCQAHYPLQALLYAVALHRFLSWRRPDYDPHQYLAGVGYLFVRGMTGRDNPVLDSMPAGVFTWTPPATMIIDASNVLAGNHD